MIVEEVHLDKKERGEKIPVTKKQTPKKMREFYSEQQKSKNIILWIGVIFLTATVFVMWILNTKLLINKTIPGSKIPEVEMLKSAKDDFQEAVSSASLSDQNESDDTEEQSGGVIDEIKNMLGMIFDAAIATSTSSTIDNVESVDEEVGTDGTSTTTLDAVIDNKLTTTTTQNES